MSDVDTAQPQPATSTPALLRAASAGQEHGWQQLVDRFQPQVAATIGAFRLQPADANDAAQATWLRLLEHHRSIRDPQSVGGWLRTIARRECLRIIRERRGTALLVEGGVLETLRTPVDLEQSVVDADAAQRLFVLIDRLPARQATLLTALFHDTPPPYRELARRCGMPIGSIGPTRARAMEALRRLFDTDEPVAASRPPVRV